MIDIYHQVGRTSKSVSEAFKDAEYACAITRFEDDFSVTMRWIGYYCTRLMWSAFMGGMAVAVIYWITR